MVRELLGLSFYEQGQWHEAASELLAYRRLTNRLDQNHIIAECYRALTRPERALEICREVSPADVPVETWAEVTMVAAGAHADKGEVQEALKWLSRADLDPRSVESYHLKLWYVRSDLLEKAGRKADAQKGWERIAAEAPDYFDVDDRLKAGAGT